MIKKLSLALGVGVLLAGKLFGGNTNAVMLTLADAEKIALQNHPQIAAADYRVLAAQEVVKETRAGFFPTLDAYGNAVGTGNEDARIMAGGLSNPSIYDRAAGGLALNQLITDFGHTAQLASSSKFHAEAEKQNAGATREQVLLEVNTSFLNALGARAVLQVAQETLDTRQLLLDQVTLLASNKLKSELDVSFARVAVEESRLLLQTSQADADNAMISLSTALGYQLPRSFQLLEPAPTNFAATNDIDELTQTALSIRPELSSMRSEQNSAHAYARAQRDARLPVVSAVGVIGAAPWRDTHLPDDYAVGGVQISLPLFAGGLYTAREHEAEFRADVLNEQLRDAEDEVVRNVHLAWSNLNNADEQLETTGHLLSNAKESYELADARYQIGSSSIVELSQAQLNLTSAEITDTSARYNVLIRQAQLTYEIGSLR
ncbi:MAG TPA: TolC family protein [Candidatus Sulfotelmatobacter sp.]|jgi:outer membrane protein|nr:TolC family protein [Candidatus Sulfotelmatobacter sp.]